MKVRAKLMEQLTVRQYYPRIINGDLRKFEGDGVEQWLIQCEKIFTMERTLEHLKVQRINRALEGRALIWHQAFTFNKKELSWYNYSEAMLQRFGNEYWKIIVELKRIKQTGNVAEYMEAFNNCICSWNLSEDYFIHDFVGGLKAEIASVVNANHPCNLQEAFALAEIQEWKCNYKAKQHLNCDGANALISKDNACVAASNHEETCIYSSSPIHYGLTSSRQSLSYNETKVSSRQASIEVSSNDPKSLTNSLEEALDKELIEIKVDFPEIYTRQNKGSCSFEDGALFESLPAHNEHSEVNSQYKISTQTNSVEDIIEDDGTNNEGSIDGVEAQLITNGLTSVDLQHANQQVTDVKGLQKTFCEYPLFGELQQVEGKQEIMPSMLQINSYFIREASKYSDSNEALLLYLSSERNRSAFYMLPNKAAKISPGLTPIISAFNNGEPFICIPWFASKSVNIPSAIETVSSKGEGKSTNSEDNQWWQEVYKSFKTLLFNDWKWYYKDRGKFLKKFNEQGLQSNEHPGKWHHEWKIAWEWMPTELLSVSVSRQCQQTCSSICLLSDGSLFCKYLHNPVAMLHKSLRTRIILKGVE